MRVNQLYLSAIAVATAAATGSLKDIKHIVLFMQENRAFDHYYGTMSGVRGFADPNVPVSSEGLSTFQQPINPPQDGVSIMTPYYINYLGGDYLNATQCMGAGSNSWTAMHASWAAGGFNNWTTADTAFSMAYFTRQDIPTHWDIVEGFTVMDMNFQSIMGPTDTNRCMWLSSSVNAPGSYANPHGDGGAMLDNTASPGCDIQTSPKANCFPFTWTTFPEVLEDAGVSWKVYQDLDNFEDNTLQYFEQYMNAPNGSALKEKGGSYPGMQAFYDAAGNGTLPEVSYIIGPQELSEHPPNRPIDGAWFQQQVVEAVLNSPAYNETVMIISYDEQGGWWDHVPPPAIAPKGTLGEWIEDPYQQFGNVPIGPGPRVPRYIISPWTRGGNVFTEYTDHTSDTLFVEEWAAANGYKGVYSKEMSQWRRDTMSNLVNIFDFDNPDLSKPYISPAVKPPTNPNNASDYTGDIAQLGSLTGDWAQPGLCLSEYANPQAPVPWGQENADQNLTLLVEEGFKSVRGRLGEGRYLAFEVANLALTNANGKSVSLSAATANHEDIRQRWIIHAIGEYPATSTFTIQSAVDQSYIAAFPLGSLTSDAKNAQAFTFSYTPNGATYSVSLSETPNSFLSLVEDAISTIIWDHDKPGPFKIYSVSYH